MASANITGYVLDTVLAGNQDPRQRQAIWWPASETGQINFSVLHANQSIFDLTGCTAIFTVYRGGSQPPWISRAATISFPVSGSGFFPLIATDISALVAQAYGYDVLLVDSVGTPHQIVPLSLFTVLPTLGVQGQVTTPVSANLAAYWGMAMIPGGGYTSSFVTGLTNSRLQSTVAGVYGFAAGDGSTLYAHFAFPATWTSPVQFKDTNTGQNIAFTQVATGINGYNIWRAPQANSAAFNYQVS